MVSRNEVHRTSWNEGGTAPLAGSGDTTGEFSFDCADPFCGARRNFSETIAVCDHEGMANWQTNVLEMHVKFPSCWNWQDPPNIDNWGLTHIGGWFYSECEERATTPNIEYIIVYPLDDNESTEGRYLASDVHRANGQLKNAPGASVHADWWGSWHQGINKRWIDNCVNLQVNRLSGCGFGYLTDGGTNRDNPLPGPALKFRPDYEGPIKVPATTLYDELCEPDRVLSSPSVAAFCKTS